MRIRTVLFAAAVVLLMAIVLTHPSIVAGPGGMFLGAVVVKDVASAAKKFSSRAALSGPDYAAGVAAAGARWQANAAAGKDNFAAGVQEAIANDRFSKGIAKAGASKYQDRASTVGAQRFPQGAQAAEQTWATNVAPYLSTIANLNLPPRGPKGDPRNQQRSQMIADALRKKKVAG
jgi:hypothetical protein